jgi:EmrB/QacA subfamily drug resistance transporter
MTDAFPHSPHVTDHKNIALLILGIAALMDVIDITIVNVAVPTIEKGLSFSGIESLQWVLTAYGLFFGGFVLLGGRLADTFGRRFILMSGVVIFGVASLGEGLAQSSMWLICCRAIQGFGAALIAPTALSLLLVIFKEGKERDKAMSVWGSVLAGGVGLGVILGGVITEYLGWRWIFFINVPICIFVLIATPLTIRKTLRAGSRKGFDSSGAIFATAGLLALVYGLTQAPFYGWGSGIILGSLAISPIFIGLFMRNEVQSKNPLVPLQLFRKSNVWVVCIISLPTMAGTTASFFFISLYNQQILGQTPVQAGLSILPIVAAFIIVAMQLQRIITKIGYKYTILVILVLFMAAMISLARLPVDGQYVRDELALLLLVAVGPTASIVLTLAATRGIKEEESGIVSGLLNTSQQLGGPLGIAVLSTIAAFYTNSMLTGLPDNAVSPSALVYGFHAAFFADAGFILIAAIICAMKLRSSEP